MKHINIPIFIPHLGCPNNCVFCNQRIISGTSFFSEENVVDIIERTLSTAKDACAEIAFFGGSFTGIDRELMIRLLDIAEKYVKDGRVSGIRMSTRPDYIDTEIIEILKNYTVSQIELGIQSMSDKVLRASKRGHDAAAAVRAVRLLTDSGFEVVGQMMIGLPCSEPDDEIYTAQKICELGCSASRIYPTVVFCDTELDLMTKNGIYTPLELDDAVERSAAVLQVFVNSGVNCIRIGLCDSDNLHSSDTYSAGPNHSALGELVVSRLYYNSICKQIDSFLERNGLSYDREEGSCLADAPIEVFCSKGSVSKVIGNKKENKLKLRKKYGIKYVKAVEKDELLGYNIMIKVNGEDIETLNNINK